MTFEQHLLLWEASDMVEAIGQDAPPHLLSLRQELLATPFYSLSTSMMTDFWNSFEASTSLQINLGKGDGGAQGLGWGAQGLGQAGAQGSSHTAERRMPRQDSPQSSSHPQGSTNAYPRFHTPASDTGGGKGGSHHAHPRQGQTYASPPSHPNHPDRRPPLRQHQPPPKPNYDQGRFCMGDDSEDRRPQKPTHTLHTAHALQPRSWSDDDTVSEEEPPSPRRAEGEASLIPITCILDTGAGPISFANPSLLHNLREATPRKVFDASGTAQKVSQRGDLQLTLPGGLRVDIVTYATDWVSQPLISASQVVSAGQCSPAVPQDR
jgi:hypothetical protein